jgi:lycopene beta-cyclase
MHKKYDLILIGRGLANLLFINQYLKNQKNMQVLILEKNKKIEKRYISAWQGPGLINLKKEFNLRSIQSFNEISLKDNKNVINREINPYKYETYQYSEIISTLLKIRKTQKIKISYCEVTGLQENKNFVVVNTNKGSYKAKYVLDSSHKYDINLKTSQPFLYQYFIGTVIEHNKNREETRCELMNFLTSKKEINFNYAIPLTNNSLLIETTIFGKNLDFNNLQKIHQNTLNDYYAYTSFSYEKGVIPMSVSQVFNRSKRIIPSGINGGLARPSSGYLLLRAANWAVDSKNKSLNKIKFKENFIIRFLDKVFLKACYYYPEQAPQIFIKLFKAKEITSVIRFLSDKPSLKDLINLIKNTPKKIMVYALFK